MWICMVVENDKAGIEIELSVGRGKRVGIRMPANVIVGFEHGNVVVTMQMMRNDVARDAGSHNGNFQPRSDARPVYPRYHRCGTLRSLYVS